MRVHLIHGIHADQPGGTVAKLEPYFTEQGYEVVVHNYGYAYALTARLLNPHRATHIAQFIAPDDIIVGHSNGCTLAWMITTGYEGMFATVPSRSCKGLVLVNAALDNDIDFHNVDWVHCYYNDGDEAVDLSNIFYKHPWGSLGRYGYKGKDTFVSNIDCADEPMLPTVDGHSALFYPPCIEAWGPYIVNKVTDAVRK